MDLPARNEPSVDGHPASIHRRVKHRLLERLIYPFIGSEDFTDGPRLPLWDGVYEVIPCYEGQLIIMPYHLERLNHSLGHRTHLTAQ